MNKKYDFSLYWIIQQSSRIILVNLLSQPANNPHAIIFLTIPNQISEK